MEGKSEPFISCIRWCQAPCLVVKTVRNESEERFKRPVQALPPSPGGGRGRAGGGTAIDRPCRYVSLWRVWFSSSLLWDRVYEYRKSSIKPPCPPLPSPNYSLLINNYSSSSNVLWVNFGLMGFWLGGHESERNNYYCFCKIQLVGQKYREKTTLASKTRFSRHCFLFSKPALFYTSGL